MVPPRIPTKIDRLPAAYRRFLVGAAVLTLLFVLPLIRLTVFALGSDLYSHIILIPLVSVALVWIRRTSLPEVGKPCTSGAVLAALAAAGALAYAFLAHPDPTREPNHILVWTTAAYVAGLVGCAFWFLGWPFVRGNIVAVAFLVFMIPMTGWLEWRTEIALQRASAEAADILYGLAGMTYLREGQVFRLPSITMEIAQECSGIHSSYVLFITSIVAGQMLLPAGWRRWTLTLIVIPLAIFRNGFRVLTLGILCERIGPHMIDHWIHHRGGPIFFLLSLIPFFGLLFLLRRIGRKRAAPAGSEGMAHERHE